MHKILLAVLLLLAGCQSAPVTKAPAGPFYSESHIDFAGWKRNPTTCCSATGSRIAIASGGEYSSKAGIEITDRGGNLADASTAVAFALAVERPFSAGLGGGGFLLYHSSKDGKDVFLDFRETAPHKASRDMYLDAQGNVIPDKSVYGAMAIATPGFVSGWYDFHKRYGKLPWKTVLEPAIRLAEEGFPVFPSLAAKIEKNKDRLAREKSIAKVVFDDKGNPLREGAPFKQPDLAHSLRLIAKDGPRVFYRGQIAKAITTYVEKRGGILDAKDLRGYKPESREPIHGSWENYGFVTSPPPSAGGVFLVEAFGMLKGVDLRKEAQDPVDYDHLVAQVMKRAYADRSKYIGDPNFVSNDYTKLMSPDYIERVRSALNLERDTPSSQIVPGEPRPETHGTTQLSLIDAEGNALSSTITINGSWGSGLVPPGTGIFLNNEMDDFSVKPGAENIYGLTGGHANAIAPLKRPVSSMTPTILFKEKKPYLAVGGAGGSRIISSVFQVILDDTAIFPGEVRRAVFAPRLHDQWLPDRLDLEASTPAIDEALKKKGYEIGPWPWKAQVEAVQADAGGKLTAVFDPRDEGGAAAQ